MYGYNGSNILEMCNNMEDKKKLYIKTYGCAMNVYDSYMIGDVVKPLGYEIVDSYDHADMVVLNTCHIREKAAEKLYSELGRVRIVQQNSKKKIIVVVAGCVAQAEGKEIINRAPNVDIVIGPQTIHSLPEAIGKVERKLGNKSVMIDFPVETKFDVLPEETLIKTDDVSALVSAQEGCDKFCTFCVVPYTRGAEYSRPVNAIYRESMRLASQGVKEISVLGQNVSAYHGDCEGKEWNLGQLLMHLAKINGIERIRYATSHPSDMHEDLFEAHRLPKIMPFKHLPVQSGSDRVLRSMNRKYTVKEYIAIINRLQETRLDIQFSSDFIVGFPGETDQDFEDTMELVEKVKFAHAYSFKYSPRPGTPGAGRKDQIPENIKDVRLQRLQKLLFAQQFEFNQSVEGQVMEVLFDKKKGRYPNQVVGKTPYLQSVSVADIKDDTGESKLYSKILPVKIVSAGKNGLRGELVSDSVLEAV